MSYDNENWNSFYKIDLNERSLTHTQIHQLIYTHGALDFYSFFSPVGIASFYLFFNFNANIL